MTHRITVIRSRRWTPPPIPADHLSARIEIITDPNCPPGVMYMLNAEAFERLRERFGLVQLDVRLNG